MKMSVKTLRTETRRLLETVARGEEVIITYRGKPRAKVVGLGTVAGQERSRLFGLWRDHNASENVQDYIDALRKSRY
ncbi:hypothetical protein BH24DEI1_BH24DEI1_17030 [soil metagenome]|jgi:prevent-host-death family protein|nr:type II toxin-antitoxin system prevent-host-death family antitoxin [Deinococcota bacterium]